MSSFLERNALFGSESAGSDIIADSDVNTCKINILATKLREQMIGLPFPLLACQTHFSFTQGTISPQDWGRFVRAYGQDARLLLADSDLAGLPVCLQEWGRERIALGALVALPSNQHALFLAPTHQAYAGLCRFLSLLHEDPDALRRWETLFGLEVDLSGLIILVCDLAWLARFREAGAEVYWRSGIRPGHPPTGVAAIAAPIITHVNKQGQAQAELLHAIRHNQRMQSAGAQVSAGNALTQLLHMPQAYRGFEEQIIRGAELLARCTHVPSCDLHMPPCHEKDPPRALRELAQRGLQVRYGGRPEPEVLQRFEHELAVIEQKEFCSYMLTVYELAQRRRTCGRGSAASSLISYCLGLTNVDPVKYNLVFERFLAPERTDPPDVDLDFPWDERDDVFRYAMEHYGYERLAMVSNHLRYRRKSALREVARAYGEEREEITAVSRSLAKQRTFGTSTQLGESWHQYIAQAQQLEEAPRHYSLHPGGLVITNGPIRELMPVHPSAKIIDGRALPAMPWEKEGTEYMGFVKIDILGNRSLAVVRDCIADLRADGVMLDEEQWNPQQDTATRKLVASGESMGCFYIESPAMRQLNKKCGSGDFDRLVVHSSIIRPAANRWINDYLERYHEHQRTGKINPAWYPHPVLRELLSESYGVLSYQEDVMLSARELAGFSSEDQNALRKCLGKSDTARQLKRFAKKFREGCIRNNVSVEVCEHIWSMISSFAGYSFCKAHSASYAMVSFQCAYLKAYYPAYFLARVIANEGGYYGASAYLEEARRRGVHIRGPCVLRSYWKTSSEGAKRIRCGFHLVPYLSRTRVEKIVAARKERPFITFTDFYIRSEVSQRDCEALEKAGAFNVLLRGRHHIQRCRLIADTVKAYPHHVSDEEKHRRRKQLETLNYADPEVLEIPAPRGRDVLFARFRFLGFLPQQHPLFLWALPKHRLYCSSITERHHQCHVCVVGWYITRKQVVAVQKRRDQQGEAVSDSENSGQGFGLRREPMSFVTLEDESGLLETVWFPKTYRKYGSLLSRYHPLRVEGMVQVEYGHPVLIVDYVEIIEHERHV